MNSQINNLKHKDQRKSEERQFINIHLTKPNESQNNDKRCGPSRNITELSSVSQCTFPIKHSRLHKIKLKQKRSKLIGQKLSEFVRNFAIHRNIIEKQYSKGQHDKAKKEHLSLNSMRVQSARNGSSKRALRRRSQHPYSNLNQNKLYSIKVQLTHGLSNSIECGRSSQNLAHSD